ncbi:TetR/AcrR family transcriptional regulator [Virgibacillus dokdonensis]|uniref:TetR/AcrR family transcriptional regulator n=1 Tax=Virgibacillus dokdonensis TaxID=302167 RepID=UPI00098B055E|nr:TetR/AcrR family transcriptional regulator [Virgibacillus dokdonensis]
MLEKKKKLMEIGMKLIAEKGYHNTSIQEIANKAGISKGSFYSYFPSKKAFTITTVKAFHIQVMEELNQVDVKGDDKERFAKQIAILMKYMEQHKDHIMMYFRSNILIIEELDQQLTDVRVDHFHWLKDNLEKIYGKQLREFLIDAIIQAEGLLHSYFHWFVLENVDLDKEQAGEFIVRRLHDLITGMLKRESSGLVDMAQISEIYKSTRRSTLEKQTLQKVLNALKEKIVLLDVQQSKKERLYEVVRLLEKEGLEDCNIVVIQGLLAHFYAYDILIEDVSKIATILNIELL